MGSSNANSLAPGLFSDSSGAQAPNMLREKASLHEGHGFSRAIKPSNDGFRVCVRTPFPNSVPEGRLNFRPVQLNLKSASV
jgi:hypothetical protein